MNNIVNKFYFCGSVVDGFRQNMIDHINEEPNDMEINIGFHMHMAQFVARPHNLFLDLTWRYFSRYRHTCVDSRHRFGTGALLLHGR